MLGIRATPTLTSQSTATARSSKAWALTAQPGAQARDPTLAELAGRDPLSCADAAGSSAFYSPLRESLRANAAAGRRCARALNPHPDHVHAAGAAAAAGVPGGGGLRYGDAQRAVHYGAPAADQQPLSARTSWDLGSRAGSEAAGAPAAAGQRGLGSAETLPQYAPGKQGSGRTIAAPGLLAHASVPVEVSSQGNATMLVKPLKILCKASQPHLCACLLL